MTQVVEIEVVSHLYEPGKYQDVRGETSCKSIFAMKMNMYLIKNVLLVHPGLTMPLVMMQVVVLTRPVMLLCVMLITMYKIIHVWHARSGKYNSEKHDASGGDTECEWITCDENEYVNNYQCLPCPPGTYNAPGDNFRRNRI